jgi:hypothetical protein
MSSTQREQKITVKPDTLNNLVSAVERGEYRIPQFQREYVWEPSKIIELLDSLYREFPIGSFFLWKAKPEFNHLFRHIVELGIPPVGEHDNISFILDGQQRITSLYVTLKGLTIRDTDYRHIVFDLKEQKFARRAPDNVRYVAVADIWGPDAMRLSRTIPAEYTDAYDRCYSTLRTYPISLVEVKDKDLPAVCKIFQRINQGGKRLDRFDLISAMTFTQDFDLRERFKRDILAPLEADKFGTVKATAITQLLALLKDGQCTERYEFSLTTEDIQSRWADAVAAIKLTVPTFRKALGVVKASYLPYEAHFTLLAYYFLKSGNRSLPAAHQAWIEKWFWRSSFGFRYSSAAPTRIGEDRILFDQLISGSEPAFDLRLNLDASSLVKVRMTFTRSSVRNAFLCLLAIKEPRHLVNNTKLDLVNGDISDFTSTERHHIFPQAFLRDHGPVGADVHSLPNFCFLPAELNKRILDAAPATYVAELRAENPGFDEALASHLVKDGAGSGIAENDYFQFLGSRSKLLIDEIHRLCGLVTTPREGERKSAADKLEERLRELIDERMGRQFGADYWKQKIPENIRTSVDDRIADTLRKNPDMKPADLAATRRKLDFCNVMDYCNIIANNGNWPAFSDVFKKQPQFQDYIAKFSDYRNNIAHGRPMPELTRMNGEVALLWFSSVLPSDDAAEDQSEEEQ